MTLITKLSLANNITETLQKLNNEKLAVYDTLNWLNKQSFNNDHVRMSMENTITEIEHNKAEIIAEIKKETKCRFPNAKKMALSSDFNEVKIYG